MSVSQTSETDLPAPDELSRSNLDTLVEEGFVVKGTIDRRTNSYTVTRKGYDLLLALQERDNEAIAALEDEF